MGIVEGMTGVLNRTREVGMDKTVAELASTPGALAARRRTALFIVGLRGHAISAATMAEQPYGFVGQCERCDMAIKVPREVAPGAAGVQGRAVDFDCPSSPR